MKQSTLNAIKTATNAELIAAREQVRRRAGLDTASIETAREYVAAIDAEISSRNGSDIQAEPNEAQLAQMKMTRGYFPYRIISGCLNVATGEFKVLANATRRHANDMMRDGWKVWELA